MAEPVSSWFVPQNILDLVSPKEAEAAASQARNTFIAGLLTGDIGAAFNNAQNQGYNTLSHGAALQEAKRKQQLQNSTNQVIMSGMDVTDLPAQAGPTPEGGNIPIQQTAQFNAAKIRANPMAPFADQAQIKALLENFSPKIDFIRGTGVDLNNPANVGRYIPEIDKNMMPMGVNAQGQTVYGNAPGTVGAAAQMAGATEGAKASAQASYKLSPVVLNDGTTVQMTDKQIADAARTLRPLTSKLSPTSEAVLGGYKPILEDQYAKYKVAADRTPQLENLIRLSANLDTNKLTESKAEVQGYLRAMGITGPESDRFLSDVANFRQGVNDLAAANIQVLSGTKSNFDIQFTKERQGTLSDPQQANKFNFTLARVVDDLNKAKYNFVRDNPTPDVLSKWEESPKGSQSVYEDPRLREFLPSKPVVSGPQKGKTAYYIPGTGYKVYD